MIDLDEPPQTHTPPAWIITFADLMVLLMCFFVLMLSFSEMDAEKFKLMSGSLNQEFGVQSKVNANDAPKGTSLEGLDFSPSVPEPTEVDEVRQHTVDSNLNTLDLGLQQRLKELRAQEEHAEQQVGELRDTFRQEVDDGRLLIRRDGVDVVIQVLEKDSFASGRAELEPGALAALAKIGKTVSGMNGAIRVSGHTDNVPIRNGQYRSNWDLSAARASSVAHELLAAGLEPTRLMVSGHADTEPRAPNDTAANRALNRRVDITFVNGKSRPDGWIDPNAPVAAPESLPPAGAEATTPAAAGLVSPPPPAAP